MVGRVPVGMVSWPLCAYGASGPSLPLVGWGLSRVSLGAKPLTSEGPRVPTTGLSTGHTIPPLRMQQVAVMETFSTLTPGTQPGALASAENSSPLPLHPFQGPVGQQNPSVAFSPSSHPLSLGAGTSLAVALER